MQRQIPHSLRTIRQLWDYVKPLGFWQGCSIYTRLHTGTNARLIQVPGYPAPMRIRANTADVVIFHRLILKEDYRLDLPHAIRRIIDAGSNIGLSVNFFSKQYPDAEIAAVEPEPANYELLVANTSWNSRVRCFQRAIWSKAEPMKIRDKTAETHAFQVERNVTQGGTSEKCVKSIDIGSLMSELDWPEVDLLKMDIEGAEAEVFSEAPAWLANVKILVVEIHEHLARGATLRVHQATEHFKTAYQHGEMDVFIR